MQAIIFQGSIRGLSWKANRKSLNLAICDGSVETGSSRHSMEKSQVTVRTVNPSFYKQTDHVAELYCLKHKSNRVVFTCYLSLNENPIVSEKDQIRV